jgi:hypothetical protein
MILGEQVVEGQYFELVNSQRAYAYAANAGICWLDNEEDFTCERMPWVLTNIFTTYTDPETDQAPWYNDDDPDSTDFLGVVGIDVTGDRNSTRTATVTQAMTGGGHIARNYYPAKSFVVRTLLVAKSDAGLQYGINWLRGQTLGTHEGLDCDNDVLTFLDTCPCACDHIQFAPCWPDTYGELATWDTAPAAECVSGGMDWWPTNYGDLAYGPIEADSETWCDWLKAYGHLLADGPDLKACCANTCVRPYLRQYHDVRVVQGPAVTNQRSSMNHNGAMATVEFTITTTDPAPYTMAQRVLADTNVGEGSYFADPGELVAVGSDPWDLGPAIKRSDLVPSTITEKPLPIRSWHRVTHQIVLPETMSRLGEVVYTFKLQALSNDTTDDVRVSIYDVDAYPLLMSPLASWRFDYLPAGQVVTIDMRRKQITARGTTKSEDQHIDGAVVGSRGGQIDWEAPRDTSIPLYVTVDRGGSDYQAVSVEVWAATRGRG